jgi:Gpi18-like mannosyltransferase
MAFFPLYPLLIRILHFLVKNYLLSALIVSNVFYILAILFLYKLVKKDYSHEIALRTVLLLSAFPTAYFLHAGYTESLFLFLVVSSFYYAINKKWFTASLLGMFASLARINGVLLFPALLAEYLFGKKETGGERTKLRISKDIFFTALIPLGSLIYLFINYVYFHNPFQFMIFQREHWFETFSSPVTGFMGALNSIRGYPLGQWLSWEAPQIFFALFAVLIILFSVRKIRFSYFIYSVLSLVIVTCCSFWLSVPRFVIVIFPIFIILAVMLRRPLYFYSVIFLFLALQVFFLTHFITWQWAF